MEADRHDDQVIGDALALVTVLDGDDDLLVTRVDRYRPPGERTVAARGVENRLGLLREHAPVGAREELAPVRLGQRGPVPRVGVPAVLLMALSPRVEDSAAGQDVDDRPLVCLAQQADHDRGRRLAAADDTGVHGYLPAERGPGQPVAPPVEHPRMLMRLAVDADRRAQLSA